MKAVLAVGLLYMLVTFKNHLDRGINHKMFYSLYYILNNNTIIRIKIFFLNKISSFNKVKPSYMNVINFEN